MTLNTTEGSVLLCEGMYRFRYYLFDCVICIFLRDEILSFAFAFKKE